MVSHRKQATTTIGTPKKKYNRNAKYKMKKFEGDDLYSWAVFYAKDVHKHRSPIYASMGITPIVSGCGREEAKDYIRQLEKQDAEKAISG